MKIGMISCGEELLFGKTLDENKLNLGSYLALRSYRLKTQVTVGDSATALHRAFEFLKDMDILCVTGGLGETHDDVTKSATESYFTNYEVEEIPNHNGTASGYHYFKDHHHVILMPGPPHENKPMFSVIGNLLPEKKFHPKRLNLTGIGEVDIEKRVKDIIRDEDFATYVGISNTALMIQDLSKVDAIKLALKDYIYSEDEMTLEEAILSLLRKKNLTLATAESVTSGIIASKLTSISGASDVYYGGVNVYQNEAKMVLLGVDEDLLNTYTAVSKEASEALSKKLKEKTKADVCLSITGYAEHEDKDLAGICYVDILGPFGHYQYSKKLRYQREKNREAMSVFALYSLEKLLLNFCESNV